jgi:hypothetical protein
MPFLEKTLLQPNITQPKFPEKIIIKPNDLTMQFLLARESPAGYIIEFLLNINPRQQQIDPSRSIQFSKINIESLKSAILANIKEYDRKYVILKEWSGMKAVFLFDCDKWLNDALSGVVPKSIYNKFSRTFRFKIMLPRMIAYDSLRLAFPKYLCRKFKAYLSSHHQMSKWLNVLFPNIITSKLQGAVQDRFDYEYDFQWNAIHMKLQTFWVLVVLYATGEFIKMLKNKPKEEKPKDFFEIKVQNQLLRINKNELLKSIGKKELFV